MLPNIDALRCTQTWGWTPHPPPSKNAYSLTKQHFQLKIDIFTSKTGKHDAYHGKQYAYHIALSMRLCPPPLKTLTRLPNSIFNWKSIYLPLKQVSTTLTMVSITHTTLRLAWGFPPLPPHTHTHTTQAPTEWGHTSTVSVNWPHPHHQHKQDLSVPHVYQPNPHTPQPTKTHKHKPNHHCVSTHNLSLG